MSLTISVTHSSSSCFFSALVTHLGGEGFTSEDSQAHAAEISAKGVNWFFLVSTDSIQLSSTPAFHRNNSSTTYFSSHQHTNNKHKLTNTHIQ